MGRSRASADETRSKKSKKRGNRVISKYASRFVGDVLTAIVESKLTSMTSSSDGLKENDKQIIKHAKSAKKWCEKMKLSVQKKISEASKIVFLPEIGIFSFIIN